LRRGDAEFGGSVVHYLSKENVALGLIGRKHRQPGRYRALPPSVELHMGLGETLRRRRSVRTFTGAPTDLAHLATIVRAAVGYTTRDGAAGATQGAPRRSTPSGGALYPIELYVAALRVRDLDPAIYLYDPYRDALCLTGAADAAARLLDALALKGRPLDHERAAMVCLLVAEPWRSMRKYGDRGMRYVFLEAGAIAQHINLVAVALGIGGVHCSSFYDDEVHQVLEVDGLYRTLVHTVMLGVPEGGG
jgi:SagB-type dehydrogenase family enzyme